MSDAEKAARMIYLNKTCYNGLYRVNSEGLFNTPYGRYKNPAICETEVLRAVSKYLSEKNVTILNKDFESAVEGASAGDFVYFDPPYDSPNLANFTGYLANGFDRKDQNRLKDTMLDLTERGVKCLLSNSSTDFIRETYHCPEFKIEYVQATRMINSRADGRGNVQEVLIRNW
jgi:DNA adenine methylase